MQLETFLRPRSGCRCSAVNGWPCASSCSPSQPNHPAKRRNHPNQFGDVRSAGARWWLSRGSPLSNFARSWTNRRRRLILPDRMRVPPANPKCAPARLPEARPDLRWSPLLRANAALPHPIPRVFTGHPPCTNTNQSVPCGPQTSLSEVTRRTSLCHSGCSAPGHSRWGSNVLWEVDSMTGTTIRYSW